MSTSARVDAAMEEKISAGNKIPELRKYTGHFSNEFDQYISNIIKDSRWKNVKIIIKSDSPKEFIDFLDTLIARKPSYSYIIE